MPVSQGRNITGDAKDIKLGRHGHQLVTQALGKYTEQALAGDMYFASTVVAGLSIPINTTTTPNIMLWNPAGSGVDAILARYAASQVSGTTAGGQIGLMTVSTVPLLSAIASGSLITAFTDDVYGTNKFCARFNASNKSRVRSVSTAAGATITAGTWIKSLGMQYGAIITTSAVHTGSNFSYDFDGEMVLSPGTSVYVASSIASSALFQQTISWYEVPASI